MRSRRDKCFVVTKWGFSRNVRIAGQLCNQTRIRNCENTSFRSRCENKCFRGSILFQNAHVLVASAARLAVFEHHPFLVSRVRHVTLLHTGRMVWSWQVDMSVFNRDCWSNMTIRTSTIGHWPVSTKCLLLNPSSAWGCLWVADMSRGRGTDRPQQLLSVASAIVSDKHPGERAAVRGWKACVPSFVQGWEQAGQVLQRLATEHCACGGLPWKLGN